MKAAAATALSTSRILGANDRIRVGVIGTGGRGQLLMGLFNKCPEAEIVALCDVYEPRLTQAKKLATATREYGDYRKVLEQKDIDALVIATPNHLHTPIAIDALTAGKDLYLEKPITHALEEAQRLTAAVEASKRVVQTGTQNRSMPHFLQARDLIVSGALGKISFVSTFFYQNYARTNPSRYTVEESKLDWKGFLGPAPAQPYDRLRYAQWRWFWDFGGGVHTDLLPHVVDVAQWFLGKDLPGTVSANGSNSLISYWQTPDTVSTCLDYPGGLIVTFNAMMGGSLEGGGTLFRGTKGMLRIARAGFTLWDEPDAFLSEGPATARPPKMEVKSEGDQTLLHVQNFLECVRSRKTPNAYLAAGIAAARAGHLANMAFRQHRIVSGMA
jgi:predicted dehydrogenase